MKYSNVCGLDGRTGKARTASLRRHRGGALSALASGNHLRENAVDGIRVDERDLEPEEPLARRFVDQVGAGIRELGEGRAQVADLVRHVMHAWTALREEAADRSVLAEGAEKLQPAVPDPDRRRLHALFLHPRTVLKPRAEEALVRLERAVEVVDGEADMVNGARSFHLGDRI